MILTPFLRIDINIIGLLYLIGAIFYLLKQLPKKSKLTTMVALSIHTCMAGLIADIIETLVHYINPELITIVLVFQTLKKLMMILIGFEWVMIVTFYIKRKETDYKIPIYLLVPIIVASAVLILNLFTESVFLVKSSLENYIVNEPMSIIYYVIVHFYFIYNAFVIFSNAKSLSKRDFCILLLFNFVPLLSILFTIVMPNVDVLWPGISIGILLALNHLEKNIVVFDNLTNALTRAAFEDFVDSLEKKDKTDFSLAFLDLDGFKLINDKFGHAEGDKALKTFASEVMNVIPKTASLIRYGGDEFIIYIDTVNNEILNGVVSQINEAINKRNASSEKPYNIKYTLSIKPYNKQLHGSISNLIRTLDIEMYNKKNQKKNRLYKR